MKQQEREMRNEIRRLWAKADFEEASLFFRSANSHPDDWPEGTIAWIMYRGVKSYYKTYGAIRKQIALWQMPHMIRHRVSPL